MALIERKTRVIDGIAPGAIPFDELLAEGRPTVLKGLVRDWPMARAGSPRQAADYLKTF